VKTNSLSKTQLVVRETCVKTKKLTKCLWNHNAKARFETLKIQIL